MSVFHIRVRDSRSGQSSKCVNSVSRSANVCLNCGAFGDPNQKRQICLNRSMQTGRKVKAMVHVESEDAGSTKRKGSLWFNDSRECWEAFSGPAVEFEPESGFDDGPGSNEPRYNLSRLDEDGIY
ncbi:hypothetical protein B0H14DRAFT_2624577 [Mycena olivaceomarginata]|nr:hypothetical protein B0H14DRAFT_2624577 [Mycena olivaceomarginata]